MERRRSAVEAVANLLQRWRLEYKIKVGHRFPSERELARRLGVNRSTVREALALLKERGILTVKQGDGIRANDMGVGGSVRWLPYLFRHANDRDAELRQLTAFFELRATVLAEILSLVAERGAPEEIDRADRALTGVTQAARYAQHWYDVLREEMDAESVLAELAGNDALLLNLAGLWEFLAQTQEVARHLRLDAPLAEARRDRLVDALRTRDGDRAREEARTAYFAAHLSALTSFEASPFQPRVRDEFADTIGASPTSTPRLGSGPLDRDGEWFDPFDWQPDR